ncbi:hypothetical protein ACFPM7_15765 [Actinokineospora guangxiensis]|uniref:Uncharacterized protein n=1 Tax=Actinokineospora guangxiensis TaxID=1490288 RepID=A0ABW0EM81_9PSEU
MQIPKDTVLEMIKGQGDPDKAARAEAELPDQIDTVEHRDVLAEYGVEPSDLAGDPGNTLGI